MLPAIPVIVLTPFYLEETILLSLIAGLLAIDERAGWQSLVSHPVFAALIIGSVVGSLEWALRAGVVLELVWLSILPMRGTRRPDTVAGSVVGIATVSLVLRHTGDPRELFIVSIGVLSGLVVGEVSGVFMRFVGRLREARLGSFEIPNEGGLAAVSRRLAWFHAFSIGFHALTGVVVVAVALPLSVVLTERLTGTLLGALATGSLWWIELLPAVGAAALVQNYWHRDLNRFLVLSAVVAMVILWIR